MERKGISAKDREKKREKEIERKREGERVGRRREEDIRDVRLPGND